MEAKIYTAFGINIDSDIRLHLPSCCGSDTVNSQNTLYMRQAQLQTFPELAQHLGKVRYEEIDSQLYVDVPWAGRWHSPDNNHIYWQAVCTEADLSSVSLYFTGLVLPIMLARRDLLLFHGSGFTNNDKAWAIMGGQGAGKSTTATAMSKLGYLILCDDVIPIESGPIMQPGIPWPKLLPDAWERFVGNPDESTDFFDGIDKYQKDIHSSYQSAPLAAVFILEIADVQGPQIHAIKGMQKIQVLLPHLTTLSGLAEPVQKMARMMNLMSTVAVYRVLRAANQDVMDVARLLAAQTEVQL